MHGVRQTQTVRAGAEAHVLLHAPTLPLTRGDREPACGGFRPPEETEPNATANRCPSWEATTLYRTGQSGRTRATTNCQWIAVSGRFGNRSGTFAGGFLPPRNIPSPVRGAGLCARRERSRSLAGHANRRVGRDVPAGAGLGIGTRWHDSEARSQCWGIHRDPGHDRMGRTRSLSD